MKKIAICVVVVCAAALYFISNHESDLAVSETKREKPAESKNNQIAMPASDKSEAPTVTVEELDIDRLLDPAFVSDPTLVLLAEQNDILPGCLHARLKAAFHGIVDTEACIEDEERRKGRFDEYKISITDGDYQFDEFTDDELRSMAISSAEASYVLAKRLKWAPEAVHFYEQAIALSGKPGPLIDFMGYQDAIGIGYTNGVLNVEKAELNYELSLTLVMLGWPDDTAVRTAEEALRNADVDVGPLRQRAENRYQRITARRIELLGRDWGE